jgi:hypothetical protein
MAIEKLEYEVIADRYTGKHRVYKKGEQIPASEVFGDLEVLLNGQKGEKTTKDRTLPDVKPRLKKIGSVSNKKTAKKVSE